MQKQRMQNLVEQAARDKTDQRNKELLKRMHEKALRINAITSEKNRKEEIEKVQRMASEQLLQSSLKEAEEYNRSLEEKKKEKFHKLAQMNENNVKQERQQRQEQQRLMAEIDKNARDESIKI